MAPLGKKCESRGLKPGLGAVRNVQAEARTYLRDNCWLLCVLGLVAWFASEALAQGGGNPAVVAAPQPYSWWTERHVDRLARVKLGNVDLLFVGDSITQNYERTGPNPYQVMAPIWDEYFAPHRALNLGCSGDQTQNVLWRIEHGEVNGLKPRDVVLLIGTNNTMDVPDGTGPQTAAQVAAGIEAVVEELHRRLAGAKITVIGILPSGVSATKSAKDAAVNAAVEARYGASTSNYVRVLNLSGLFVKDGALDIGLFYDPRQARMPPLHPDIVGQRKMAAAVAAALYSH